MNGLRGRCSLLIDIENQVFTAVKTAVRGEYQSANVVGEYVRSPAKFPHVSVVETDNYTSSGHRDSADTERYATVTYEVNAYSNKTSGKKTECRGIMAIVDQTFYSMNFTRISMAPVPNQENATVYRITARYRAETDGERIFRI